MSNQCVRHIQTPLSRLFLPHELVFTCGPILPGSGPLHSGTDTLENPPDPNDVFFAINPLLDRTARKSENVAAFRNFLFEMDTVPLDEQCKDLNLISSNIPVAMATFSGGKSIHMIISLVDELPTHETPVLFYKTVWRALAETLEEQLGRGILFDRACQDPARLSRLPGAQEPGRSVQKLMHTGGFIAWDDLYQKIAARLRQVRPTVPSAIEDPNMSVEAFEAELRARMSLSNLRMKLTAPESWAAPAGMYGEIFRLTLWAIDSTGVPQSTLLRYFHTKVFPILKAAGYPRDLERPVLNAYAHKQR